ncbi:hypothetical protein [Anaerotignum sp.]
MEKKLEKILVLVTAQKSSLRLIEYGFEVAQSCGGEYHILHVQKGDSLFQSNDSLKLLQNLADYGCRRGGILHLACEGDVAAYIGRFAEAEEVTQVILGQPPAPEGKKGKKKRESEFEKILAALPEGVKVLQYPPAELEQADRRKIG